MPSTRPTSTAGASQISALSVDGDRTAGAAAPARRPALCSTLVERTIPTTSPITSAASSPRTQSPHQPPARLRPIGTMKHMVRRKPSRTPQPMEPKSHSPRNRNVPTYQQERRPWASTRRADASPAMIATCLPAALQLRDQQRAMRPDQPAEACLEGCPNDARRPGAGQLPGLRRRGRVQPLVGFSPLVGFGPLVGFSARRLRPAGRLRPARRRRPAHRLRPAIGCRRARRLGRLGRQPPRRPPVRSKRWLAPRRSNLRPRAVGARVFWGFFPLGCRRASGSGLDSGCRGGVQSFVWVSAGYQADYGPWLASIR